MRVKVDEIQDACEVIRNYICMEEESFEEWMIDEYNEEMVTHGVSITFENKTPVFVNVNSDEDRVSFYASVDFNYGINEQHTSLETIEELAKVFCSELGLQSDEYLDVLEGYTIEADSILYTMKYEDGELMEDKKY